MKELINRKDINGIQLREGDIIAEGKIGEVIWDGEGVIISRSLGVVEVYHSMNAKPMTPPEETDRYDIVQIRKGIVELSDNCHKWMKDDDTNTCELNLSKYDGCFYNWENVERIGSVYDLDIKTEV